MLGTWEQGSFKDNISEEAFCFAETRSKRDFTH
jgi:hypothetical protein